VTMDLKIPLPVSVSIVVMPSVEDEPVSVNSFVAIVAIS
jgi:hypothetical protein